MAYPSDAALAAAGAAPAVVRAAPRDRRDGAARLAATLGGLAYGGDYNPEQWPEEVWEADARLMKQAGVNLVTVGVFSWANLQSDPETWTFGWLDRVLDVLHGAGVKVDLATATASPPPWLARAHPETLPVTVDGTTLWPGGRQHYCPSSAAYRDAAVTLTRRMAERYADHPALALWHSNNEYGCHVPVCWCDRCAVAFRHWLADRYATLDELNAAWGTDFWSQRSHDWDEIWPPRTAPTFPNPSQQLDYRRFASDALLSCFLAEREVLDTVGGGLPITTNAHPNLFAQDWSRWAPHLDVLSFDSYPDPGDPQAHRQAGLWADLLRGLGDGAPWLLMEQAPSAVNWRHRNPMKAPGTMRRWSLQAVARGADAVLFFQWRASVAGAEKFHSAMIGHADTAGSRTFDEVVGLGAELRLLAEVAGAEVEAEVGLLVDWESWWALELPSKPSADVRGWSQLGWLRGPLDDLGLTTRCLVPGADLSGLRLLVVPNLYLCAEETAAWLASFVADGGTLVVGFFSGIVDGTERIHAGGFPGPLSDLLGLRVPEVDPLPESVEVAVEGPEGRRGTASLWREAIELHGAEPVVVHRDGWLDGRPAVTRHGYGKGVAYYLGARLDEAGTAAVLTHAAGSAECRPPIPLPSEEVEVVRRRATDGRSWLFLLNHADEPIQVPLGRAGLDLLTGRRRDHAVALPPGGVVALREDGHA